ncbi:MAG: TraX family protein [Prevotella sp.]
MRNQCLSGSSLKVIAMVTMVIDHTACYFVSGGWEYECMRGIGRIAFPIFAFLIAEGYRHTRRKWDYGRNLLIFALISEIPWMLLHTDGSHNVLFTLLAGLCCIAILDKLESHKILPLLFALAIALATSALNTDYGIQGVALVMMFYLFKDKPLILLLFALLLFYDFYPLGILASLGMISLYNGERGFIKGAYSKYLFYAFYPCHLMVIWALLVV